MDVSDGPGSNLEPPWPSAVRVREDPELAAELRPRWEAAHGERAVSVTDLIAPRATFWRWTAPPVPFPPEREARIEAGRRVHRVLGDLLAAEGSVEVRVRRHGLVGRLDALTDRPIEFKTTTSPVAPDALVRDRAEYVEQLGMYCALVGRPAGRLITIAASNGPVPDLRTLDVDYRDLDGIARTMEGRAARLRAAAAANRPDGLPRCRWFDRGCEYRERAVCSCDGSEPDEPALAPGRLVGVVPRPELDARLAPRLADALRGSSPSRFHRFHDLVYPRRAYFERRDEAPDVAASEGQRPPSPVSPSYLRLLEVVEGGPVGEVARLPTRSDEPEEEVPAFRGKPFLARTSRAGSFPPAEELATAYPQYALELGFRCSATGTDVGRAIVVHERAADPAAELRVFEFRFSPVTTFSRLWRSRVAAIEHALAIGDPGPLPACPAWMFAGCPYRARCACNAEPGRSQR